MNFVTSVFKKYIKNEGNTADNRQHNRGNKEQPAAIPSTSNTDENRSYEKSNKSDDDEQFQDAEANPVSINLNDTSKQWINQPIISSSTNQRNESTSNTETASRHESQLNRKRFSCNSSVTEPDSLNTSMIDSLDGRQEYDDFETNDLIDSIEIPQLTDIDNLTEFGDVSQGYLQNQIEKISNTKLEVCAKNETESKESSHEEKKSEVVDASNVETIREGALEVLIRSVNETLVLNDSLSDKADITADQKTDNATLCKFTSPQKSINQSEFHINSFKTNEKFDNSSIFTESLLTETKELKENEDSLTVPQNLNLSQQKGGVFEHAKVEDATCDLEPKALEKDKNKFENLEQQTYNDEVEIANTSRQNAEPKPPSTVENISGKENTSKNKRIILEPTRNKKNEEIDIDVSYFSTESLNRKAATQNADEKVCESFSNIEKEISLQENNIITPENGKKHGNVSQETEPVMEHVNVEDTACKLSPKVLQSQDTNEFENLETQIQNEGVDAANASSQDHESKFTAIVENVQPVNDTEHSLEEQNRSINEKITLEPTQVMENKEATIDASTLSIQPLEKEPATENSGKKNCESLSSIEKEPLENNLPPENRQQHETVSQDIDALIENVKVKDTACELTPKVLQKQDPAEFEKLEKQIQNEEVQDENRSGQNPKEKLVTIVENLQPVNDAERSLDEQNTNKNQNITLESTQALKDEELNVDAATLAYERQDTKEFEKLEQIAQNSVDTPKLQMDDLLEFLVTESTTSNDESKNHIDSPQSHTHGQDNVQKQVKADELNDDMAVVLSENILVAESIPLESETVQKSPEAPESHHNLADLASQNLETFAEATSQANKTLHRQDTREFEVIEKQCLLEDQKEQTLHELQETEEVPEECPKQKNGKTNRHLDKSESDLRVENSGDIAIPAENAPSKLQAKDLATNSSKLASDGNDAVKSDELKTCHIQEERLEKSRDDEQSEAILSDLMSEIFGPQTPAESIQSELSGHQANRTYSRQDTREFEAMEKECMEETHDQGKLRELQEEVEILQVEESDKSEDITERSFSSSVETVISANSHMKSAEINEEAARLHCPTEDNHSIDKCEEIAAEKPDDPELNANAVLTFTKFESSENKTDMKKMPVKPHFSKSSRQTENKNRAEVRPTIRIKKQNVNPRRLKVEKDDLKPNDHEDDESINKSAAKYHKNVDFKSTNNTSQGDEVVLMKFKQLLEEYEKQIVSQATEVEKLKQEAEMNVRHFTNTEMAFSDVFEKYEKSKAVIAIYRRNEDVLIENIQLAEEQLAQLESKCMTMKQQSMDEIRRAEQLVNYEKEKYKRDITKMEGQIRRLEIKASSLELALKHKNEECRALASLCDDITGRSTE